MPKSSGIKMQWIRGKKDNKKRQITTSIPSSQRVANGHYAHRRGILTLGSRATDRV